MECLPNKLTSNVRPHTPLSQYLFVNAFSYQNVFICLISLEKSAFETRKSAFYFTSKAPFVLEIFKF